MSWCALRSEPGQRDRGADAAGPGEAEPVHIGRGPAARVHAHEEGHLPSLCALGSLSAAARKGVLTPTGTGATKEVRVHCL